MIIKNITLENFKSYKNTTINFDLGVSLILGLNGVGKSTIFEAISYAFFKDVKGKMDDIVRKGDENEIIKETKVTINFSQNGNDYNLVRGKRGSKNIAELTETSKRNGLYATGDTLVTNELQQLLGVDKNSYSNAVYIKQGEITELIDKTSGERKELIGKLLNIDNLQKAWENIKKIISEYEQKKQINNARLEKEDEEKEEKQKIRANIEISENELITDTTVIKDKEEKNEKIYRELEDLREKENKYKQYKNNIDSIRDNIKKEEKNKEYHEEQLNTIEEKEKENKELEKKIKPLDKMKELRELRQKYHTEENELIHINENIDKLKKQKEILEKSEENYRLYNECNKKLDEIKLEKDKILKEKQKLDIKKEEKDKIKIEKKNLGKSINKIVEKAHNILNSNFKKPEEVEEKVNDTLTKYQKEIENKTNLINNNNIKISSYKTVIKSTEKSLKELEEAENICPICQSDISDAKHIELSAQYQKDIQNNKENIEKIESENQKYNHDIRHINSKIEEINQIDLKRLSKDYTEFIGLNDKINALKDELKDYDIIEENYDKIANQIELTDNKIKELTDDYESHKTAENILKEYDEESLTNKKGNIVREMENTKNNMHIIQSQIPLTDNIVHEIEYLENQKAKFEKNEGIISTKPSLLKNIENTNNNLTQWKNQLHNYSTELKELSFDDEYYKQINTEYISISQELEKLKLENVRKSNNLEHLKQSLKDIDKKLEEYAQIHEEQTYLTDYIKLLTNLRELYSKNGIQKILINIVKPKIEKYTREYFDEFNLNYKDIKLDEEYQMTITNMENNEISIGLLSGGERVILALSLRLAIARVLTDSKSDLLILDEPTIHLDSERCGTLVEILRDSKVATQMFVITHDEVMEGISDNIIRIHKSNGISSIQ